MCPNHAGRQHAHAEAAEAADEVFGQHGQAFLQSVVTGQADFELAERLLVAVVAGDEVRADFVLQQRFDAAPRHARPAADQKLVAGDHQAGVHVVAYRNLGREVGPPLLVVAEFFLRAFGELGRIQLTGF